MAADAGHPEVQRMRAARAAPSLSAWTAPQARAAGYAGTLSLGGGRYAHRLFFQGMHVVRACSGAGERAFGRIRACMSPALRPQGGGSSDRGATGVARTSLLAVEDPPLQRVQVGIGVRGGFEDLVHRHGLDDLDDLADLFL